MPNKVDENHLLTRRFIRAFELIMNDNNTPHQMIIDEKYELTYQPMDQVFEKSDYKLRDINTDGIMHIINYNKDIHPRIRTINIPSANNPIHFPQIIRKNSPQRNYLESCVNILENKALSKLSSNINETNYSNLVAEFHLLIGHLIGEFKHFEDKDFDFSITYGGINSNIYGEAYLYRINSSLGFIRILSHKSNIVILGADAYENNTNKNMLSFTIPYQELEIFLKKHILIMREIRSKIINKGDIIITSQSVKKHNLSFI